jgi:type II secretory ATPase GspE/PulE/Tfp pilus assembly ATPase PilB-like protein
MNPEQIDQPVVIQFVNRIIEHAINSNATALRLSPGDPGASIEYLIDGQLRPSVDDYDRNAFATGTSGRYRPNIVSQSQLPHVMLVNLHR